MKHVTSVRDDVFAGPKLRSALLSLSCDLAFLPRLTEPQLHVNLDLSNPSTNDTLSHYTDTGRTLDKTMLGTSEIISQSTSDVVHSAQTQRSSRPTRIAATDQEETYNNDNKQGRGQLL